LIKTTRGGRRPILEWTVSLALLVAVSGCGAPSAPSGGAASPVAGAFPQIAVPQSASSAVAADGPGRAVEIQGMEHVNKGDPHAPYTTRPPTSGPHWSILGEAPVPWGIYQEPVPDEAQVHNLEHGGVMIQYNCRDCPELVTQLEGLAGRYVAANLLPRYPQSAKLVVAPYYDMPSRIALTAWGRIDTLDGYDEARITRFVDAYRDKGPEAVP
jgi:hypothetical protein